MGLPSIIIAFVAAARTAIIRIRKGVVGLIVRDSKKNGSYSLTSAEDIPAELGEDNRNYIARAFTGYVRPPRRVVLLVIPTDGSIVEALGFFATQSVDYLCGPVDCTQEEAQTIASWVKSQRAGVRKKSIVKAVLPNCAADYPGVINFTSTGMTDGTNDFSTAAFCSRIAGLLAGTPEAISATYAPLPELTDLDRLSDDEADAAIDAGQFILMHDGSKVKVARAVNSLVNPTGDDQNDTTKKIKIVETLDIIATNFYTVVEDTYIGKIANSYENKLVLNTALLTYLRELESGGVLKEGSSTVDIDVDRQEDYLKSIGVDTSELDEQEIREYNTDDQVFILGNLSILDAMEDVRVEINY